MDIKPYLAEKRELVDSYLRSYFHSPFSPSLLHDAVTYSLFAGGKRIRPILALASYEACGGNAPDIIPQATALELIHTYSLIHDDLPAMDDDDLRRGKPTSHKVFGEAMAILAGDALLTEAFYMMTSINPLVPSTSIYGKEGKKGIRGIASRKISCSVIIKAMREVAFSAGIHGMVGGQAQDILSEDAVPDQKTLEFIHFHKTAALIAASVKMGPILARSRNKMMRALTNYGENIGLVFQIIDDILDIEGTPEEIGKPAGSDKRKKKMTYPVLYGINGAKQKANELISGAIDAISIFPNSADPLREIARYLLRRRA
jgi:geranylgeranyl diphosphate synthase, type II